MLKTILEVCKELHTVALLETDLKIGRCWAFNNGNFFFKIDFPSIEILFHRSPVIVDPSKIIFVYL